MAIPTYSVNGITLYGVTSSWERVIKRRTPAGITFQPYAMNNLSISQMEISTFLILQALSGRRLSSLGTNDIDDVGTGITYTSAEIVEAVNTAQIGRRATGCRISIRVDVS